MTQPSLQLESGGHFGIPRTTLEGQRVEFMDRNGRVVFSVDVQRDGSSIEIRPHQGPMSIEPNGSSAVAVRQRTQP